MANVTLIQNNFMYGEVSPKLMGRVDSPAYLNGCRTMENFLPMRTGGFRMRPGTYWVGDPYTAGACRLIPWKTSAGTCICELMGTYARFWKTDHTLFGAPTLLSTPWAAADLFNLRYVADGDDLWVVHPSYPPRKFHFNGTTFDALATPTFTGSRTFAAANAYPSVIGVYQGRLVLGGPNAEPNSLFMSRAANTSGYRWTDFTLGTNPDDAIIYPIPDALGSRIRWVATHRRLLVGTDLSVWQDNASFATNYGISVALDPFHMEPIAYVGSAAKRAAVIGNHVLFLGSATPSLHMLVYSSNDGGFVDVEATRFADHILKPGAVEIATMVDPEQIAWIPRTDGQIASCTIDSTTGGLSIGWARHALADGGLVESAAVVRGSVGDELWMVVLRGAQRRIEYLTFTEDSDFEEIHYVDCGFRKVNSPAAATVTGLSVLEGKAVHAIADGSSMPEVTVASGAVTYAKAVGKVHIGLPYIPEVLPQRPELPINSTWQAKKKRVEKTTLRLLESYGGQAGQDEDSLQTLAFTGLPGQDFGGPPAPFTGDKEVPTAGTVDTDGAVLIHQPEPFPFTVLAMITRIAIMET